MKFTKGSNFTRIFVNPNLWIWITTILSIIIIGLVSLLHFQQQKSLQASTVKLESMRLARIDLNRGFLYIVLSDSPGSPFDRGQGLALLNQAIASLDETVLTDTPEAEKTMADFRMSMKSFQDALTQWRQQSMPDPASYVKLRVTFSELENQANKVDSLSQLSLNKIANRLNFEFGLILAISAVILAGICFLVYFSGRIKERTDLALELSEEKYRQLIKLNPVPLVYVNNVGVLSYLNDRFIRLFGYSRQDLTTLDEWWRLAYPEAQYRRLIIDAWEKALANACNEGGDIKPFESTVICKDGKKLLIEISGITIEGNFLLTFIDMTDRKKAEESLRQSEEKYRLIFDNAADGIFIVDNQGKFHDINSSGSAMLGYSSEEIKQLNLHDLISAKDQDKIPLLLNEIGEGENGSLELQMYQKNGSPIVANLNMRILPDKRVLGMVRNISEYKLADEQIHATQARLQNLLKEADLSRKALLSMVEDHKRSEDRIRQLNSELEQRVRDRTAQLQAANQELEAFSYSVSHDLRAPLRALDGYSNLLLSDYPEKLDEQGRHYLSRIKEASKRMGELIEDLLDLSRITRSEFTRRQVNMSAIAFEVAKTLEEQEPNRKVEFKIMPDLIVEGDGRLLRIVLENLMSNAFKFTSTRDQANIEVGMHDVNGEKIYFVKDNGVGFDMTYAGKLFTPFQRLHGTREFAGTGVGLVIVKRIVTRHGGRIWPEAGIEQGATFNFTLGDTK